MALEWHKWSSEKPVKTGEYLVRGIGGLNHKLHYWVCLWIGEDTTFDSTVKNKLFYGGNEFDNCDGDFEWISVNELQ